MKNNQKYTQEEMYLAIELWKESGLPQQKYSRQNSIAYNTFKYWVRKYNREKQPVKPVQANTFLPVQVKTTTEAHLLHHTNKEITITYPNGIEVKCPVDIGTIQLKTLLTI
jgi:transposase-like protein